MKRPETLTLYLTPIKEPDSEFIDWNGKKRSDYCVHLPCWLVRAYNLDKHIMSVKVEVTKERKSFSERFDIQELGRKYYMANWAKKMQKRRYNTRVCSSER